MHSFRSVAALLAVAFIAVFPGVAGAASAQQATLQKFVGTWTCVTTTGKQTYRETDVDTMYGNWVRSSGSYPAQGGQPAGTSTTFFGYDGKSARWVVTGVGTNGSYFTASSSSPNFNGSSWSDIYPADHGGAVIHMASSQYTMDSHDPDGKGKMSTSHTVCKKHA